VTQLGLLPELQALDGLTTICLDRDAATIALEESSDFAPEITPQSLAYVIYTSGSTGQPKGARLTHHNAVRLSRAIKEIYDFDQRDVWTLFHSIAFDFSVWEMFGALLSGGALVVVPYWVARDPMELFRLVSARNVTVLGQTPSAFAQFIRADQSFAPPLPLSLRWIVLAGESLNVRTLEPWFDRHGDEQPRIVNMYGITETSVATTYRPVSSADLGDARSLIGHALCDIPAYVLDERLQPVPLGVAGELCTGGDAVGAGYVNRPDLDAARFLRDPFRDDPGARLYRTGDLVRQLADGSFEYLGRIDDQVKLRGFRIELGEIKAALEAHPAVLDSLVVVTGEQLVAYVIPRHEDPLPLADLRTFLRRTLPEHMVPAAFVRLHEFPLTGNGKIDRRALPAPVAESSANAPNAEPRRAIEKVIAGVWKEVLEIDKAGLYDNFFDLGGHSLHMVRARTRLEQVLRVSLAMPDMFACPTIHSLADFIGGSGLTPAEKAAPPRKRNTRKQATARLRGPA
jgi:amino acid adenylation domain-containing protein